MADVSAQSQALKIFFSYAHQDEALRNELADHLSILRRQGLISEWYDRNISAGTKWEQLTDEHLNTAHIILLLVSSSYLASDYCYSVQMQRALERDKAGEARVIPIILRPVSWEDAPFAMLQALPRDGIPITSKQWESHDAAWTDVVTELRKVLTSFTPKPPAWLPTLPSTPAHRIFHVPYRRNPLFVGREDLLKQIHDRLTTNKAAALTQAQAICGLGGIGKTQTALEYAYLHRQEYRFVFWVSAASAENLLVDLTKLASLIGLTKLDGHEPQKIVAAIKKWLEEHENWLLIFDNADNLQEVAEYIATLQDPSGHTLLTTRAQSTGTLAAAIGVEQMSESEGALLLLRRAKVLFSGESLEKAPAKSREEAEAIVTELGGLPLALDQAGAYIEETGSNLSEYLSLYRTHRKELLKRRSTLPSEHPEPVAATWDISFQQVEQANPAAADLLRICAFLAPDAIPEEIFTKGGKGLGPILAPVAVDPFKLDGAIEELRKFSLVRRNAEARHLSLHRLVQAVLKDQMVEETAHLWAERAITAVWKASPDVDETRWLEWQPYLSQVQECSLLVDRYNLKLVEAANLLQNAARILDRFAYYEQAEALYQQSLLIYKQTRGPEHPNTATSLHNLAKLYQDQGKYEQAESLYQQALSIYKQTRGPVHPDTAGTLHELARLSWHQGKYELAEALLQQALSIYKQTRGPVHPFIAMTIQGLAVLYQDQGKYEQAESLYQQALSIKRQTLGLEHPSFASALRGLAVLYYSQERYEQAEPLFQQALAIDEKVFGPDHPNVATDLEAYANFLRKTNRSKEAQKLQARAKSIRAKQQK